VKGSTSTLNLKEGSEVGVEVNIDNLSKSLLYLSLKCSKNKSGALK
jgi:hypothetical protein